MTRSAMTNGRADTKHFEIESAWICRRSCATTTCEAVWAWCGQVRTRSRDRGQRTVISRRESGSSLHPWPFALRHGCRGADGRSPG